MAKSREYVVLQLVQRLDEINAKKEALEPFINHLAELTLKIQEITNALQKQIEAYDEHKKDIEKMLS